MIDKDIFNADTLSSEGLPPMPQCDVEQYRPYLKDTGLTEAEQDELIETVWFILAAFVQREFGVDSIQLLPSSTVNRPALEDDG